MIRKELEQMSEAPGKGTYVLDSESPLEMTRLIEQQRRVIQAMGGTFAGLPELPEGGKVLDMACGPGSWILDAAFERPDIKAVGVDISKIMINYASARARTQGLTNATFAIMNITRTLDFAASSFDLVTASGLVAVLQQDNWKPFIAECTRLLRPGGFLRLIEPYDFGETNSVAITKLQELGTQTLRNRGYGFSIDGHTFGMAHTLPSLLRQTGYINTKSQAYTIEFSFDQPAWVDFYRNYQSAYQQAKMLWLQAGLVTEEIFDQLYQQMIIDMNKDNFQGMTTIIAISGEKPA
jgi:ubiquinone/menaquinone biosynthesis C-methylase UbiE